MKDEYSTRHRIGLFAGLPLFVLFLLLPRPEGMSPEAQKTLAVTILMAFWWITEALPIPATALMPLILFPLLKVDNAQNVARQFGDNNIYLFMGGFFLATAIEKCGLHRRIALKTVSILGTGPKKIVFGMMCTTAFLSMWISNTATAMMMLPIAVAIAKHAELLNSGSLLEERQFGSFETALLFGIGYAASIGGIGTLIGTPPNIIFASQVRKLFPSAPEISFFQWFIVGFPLVVFFIPVAWFYLVHIAHPVRVKSIPGGKAVIRQQLKELGSMKQDEKYVLIVFLMTALGWIFLRNIDVGLFTIPGWSNLLGIEDMIHDSTVAILASIFLFMIPVDFKGGEFLLDWKSAVKIPWGILLLFGGGLALAHEFQTTGLAEWIGSHLSVLKAVPILLAVVVVVFLLDFLTEVTSNTAITSLFMPILAATSIGMGVHPYLFMIAGTIAASLAFMLPVATPPNAVIFSSGYITLPQMARTGFFMNLLGMIITTAVVYALAIPVFRITLTHLPEWVK
ncbi:MAG: DASS family sodium-coupled anion symporter [bacterium]